MKTPSLGWLRYFVVFANDDFDKNWIYFMDTKDKIFRKFQEFRSQVERKTKSQIRNLRTNRRREYLTNKFNSFLTNHGIIRQLTMAYTL